MGRGEKFEAICKLLYDYGNEHFELEYGYDELGKSEVEKEDHEEELDDIVLKYALWIMGVMEDMDE